MNFVEQYIKGVYIIEPKRFGDERGYFCETWKKNEFEKFIPYIALALLGYIGGKMLYEGITNKDEDEAEGGIVSFAGLLVQGVATSIDALSVGLDIGSYGLLEALLCCLLIAFVTFFICMGGLILGKKVGTKLAGKAAILGGAILIFIGLEIFITGVFF